MNTLVRRPGFSAQSDLEYGLNIQRGRVPGVSVVHKFGRNPSIATADGVKDLWNDLGVDHYTGFDATVADTVEVFSSDPGDSQAGAGARLVQLVGLGADFVAQTEIIPLDGATQVQSQLQYLRLDRALILTSGSVAYDAGNLGIITCRQVATPAVVFFNIAIKANRTTIGAYTIPADHVGYVSSAFLTLANKTASAAEPRALVRFPGSTFQTVEWLSLSSAGTSYVPREYKVPLIGVPAGTDIKLASDSDVGGGGVGIAGGFEILLVGV